jgi:hypothetical protein
MAVAKFREAHVNKRAEYFQDDMLDELLRELERMEIVVFYWRSRVTLGSQRGGGERDGGPPGDAPTRGGAGAGGGASEA